MDSINVGIITDDYEYGGVLGKCISGVHRDILVTLYRKEDMEKIPELPPDVLVYDLRAESGGVPQADIFLCEKIPAASDRDEKKILLWRYEKVPNIVREIVYVYEKKHGKNPEKRGTGQAFIFGVLSASGGTGCSAVAWACLQEFRRFYGKRTCYISLESFESTGCYVHMTGSERTADEYLYRVMSEDIPGSDKRGIETFLAADDYGTEALVPFRGINKLTSLSSDELSYFLKSIAENGRFDVIMIDYGGNVSQAFADSFELCRKLCVVSDPKEHVEKNRKLIRYIESISNGKYIGKTVYVRNRTAGFEAEKSRTEKEIVLPYSEKSFIKNETVRIALDGRFGDGIKNLVKELNRI